MATETSAAAAADVVINHGVCSPNFVQLKNDWKMITDRMFVLLLLPTTMIPIEKFSMKTKVFVTSVMILLGWMNMNFNLWGNVCAKRFESLLCLTSIEKICNISLSPSKVNFYLTLLKNFTGRYIFCHSFVFFYNFRSTRSFVLKTIIFQFDEILILIAI